MSSPPHRKEPASPSPTPLTPAVSCSTAQRSHRQSFQASSPFLTWSGAAVRPEGLLWLRQCSSRSPPSPQPHLRARLSSAQLGSLVTSSPWGTLGTAGLHLQRPKRTTRHSGPRASGLHRTQSRRGEPAPQNRRRAHTPKPEASRRSFSLCLQNRDQKRPCLAGLLYGFWCPQSAWPTRRGDVEGDGSLETAAPSKPESVKPAIGVLNGGSLGVAQDSAANAGCCCGSGRGSCQGLQG